MDANSLVKDMYAKQYTFAYWDNPRKKLARKLAEVSSSKPPSPKIFRSDGTFTKDLQEKVQIFAGFYTNLFLTSNPDTTKIVKYQYLSELQNMSGY